MIALSSRKWSSSAGRIFIAKRLYYKNRWTPFIRLSLRYWS